MSERYTPEEIKFEFAGEHGLRGKHYNDVVEVLSKLPMDVADYIIENICISDCPCDSGQFIPYEVLERRPKGLILFCCYLWNREQDYIDFTIAHEVAHAYLNHRAPMLGLISNEEYEQQEKQADELAIEWGFARPSGWPRGIRNLTH